MKWEYKTITVNTKSGLKNKAKEDILNNLNEQLKSLGDDDYELVATNQMDVNTIILYFKRPVIGKREVIKIIPTKKMVKSTVQDNEDYSEYFEELDKMEEVSMAKIQIKFQVGFNRAARIYNAYLEYQKQKEEKQN